MSQHPEIISAPYTIWIAPVGADFPAVYDNPGAVWKKLGSHGDRNYGPGGVQVSHQQQWDSPPPPAGQTASTVAMLESEEMRLLVELLDLTLEEYARAIGGNSVSRVIGAPGVAGVRRMGLSIGPGISREFALLVRGPSPYLAGLPAQYELPRVCVNGSPQPVFGRGAATALALVFKVLPDPAAVSEDERFGRLIGQDAAAGAPLFVTLPSISGVPNVGQVLTASDGTVEGGTFTSRQWTADGADIPGATGTTYTPVAGDGGKLIGLRNFAAGVGGNTTVEALAVGPIATLSVLEPAAQWNGTAGTGFGTANPAAPTDPTRTTAKPGLRLLTPSHQWFTDTLDVGVIAMANDNGSLADNFGIANVKFHYEGNIVTVDTPRWYTIQTQRGLRTYFGWWVRLKKPASVAGRANLYVEATANDPTMQKRVMGPYPFSPRDALHDLEIEINPDLAEVTGVRYQTFAPAILHANTTNAQNPRFTVTKAGKYEFPETLITSVNRWDNTGRYTVEASVDGVSLGRNSYTGDGAANVSPQRAWWCFRGSNLTWDNRHGAAFGIGTGPAGEYQARHWMDGITITTTSPAGKAELVRGMRWNAYGIAPGSWFTEVNAHDIYVPYRAAQGGRGCTGFDIAGDVISDSSCMVFSDFRSADTFFLSSDTPGFTLSYSGAATTVTAARSGGNLSSGSGGGIFTVVIDGDTYTFNHGNGSEAFFTGASGDGYWVGDVVDWLNTLPGVTATLSAELTAADRAAAAIALPGGKGQGFAATSFKDAPLSLVWNADEHGDWYQLTASGLENAIIAFNRAWDMDVQFIFLAPITAPDAPVNDVFFVGNALAMKPELEANYFSQLSRNTTFSHLVIAHNSMPNQSWSLDDRPDNADFSPGYNLFTHNAIRGLGWRVSGVGVTGIEIKQNHCHAGSGIVQGLYTLSSGTAATLYADFDNGDFTPTAVLTAEGFAPAIPTDLLRANYPAVAAVGALSAPAVVSRTFAPTFVSSVIDGEPADGEVLTANFVGTGVPTPTATYQWQRNGVNIAGQTAKTITLDETAMGLVSADVISCEITLTNGVGSPAAAEPTVLYAASNIDRLKASSATLAVYDWTNTASMTAGDGGAVVQGDGDTIATVPNAKTPGTLNLVQATPGARPIYNNGAVHDGTDDFLRIPFTSGAGPANTVIVYVVKTSDTQFMLAGTNSAAHFAGAAESGTSSPHNTAQGSVTYHADGTLISPTQRGAVLTAWGTGSAVIARISNANFQQTGVSDIRTAYSSGFFLNGRAMPIAVLNGANGDIANAIAFAEAEAARVITALGL